MVTMLAALIIGWLVFIVAGWMIGFLYNVVNAILGD